ncbi:MAG: preprotein translocase subunit Sec61beta [Candidatus Aenigmatarchaeota archaeon]
MAEEKKYMPQSTAGLIRYFDVEEGIKLKPDHVVVITILFTAAVLILKFMA